MKPMMKPPMIIFAAADRFIRGDRAALIGTRGLARFSRRSRLQHFRAGGPFRIFQKTVLMNDERAPGGIIIRMPNNPPENRDQHDAHDLEIEPENHDRRHGHAEAEGDRFAGRAGGLDDVVLENGRIAQPELREQAEDRDRKDRDRNRGADRDADLEDEIKRRGAEDDPEQRADDDAEAA